MSPLAVIRSILGPLLAFNLTIGCGRDDDNQDKIDKQKSKIETKESKPKPTPEPEDLAETLSKLVNQTEVKHTGLNIDSDPSAVPTLKNQIALVKAIDKQLSRPTRCATYPNDIVLGSKKVGVYREFRSVYVPSVTPLPRVTTPIPDPQPYQPIQPTPTLPDVNTPAHPPLYPPVNPSLDPLPNSTMTSPLFDDVTGPSAYPRTHSDTVNGYYSNVLNLNVSSDAALAESIKEVEAVNARCAERASTVTALQALGIAVDLQPPLGSFHHPALLNFVKELNALAADPDVRKTLSSKISISADMVQVHFMVAQPASGTAAKNSWVDKSNVDKDEWVVHFKIDAMDFTNALAMLRSPDAQPVNPPQTILPFFSIPNPNASSDVPVSGDPAAVNSAAPARENKDKDEGKETDPYGLPRIPY